MTKELLEKYIKIKTRLPAPPKPIPTFALDKIPVIEQINYDTIIHQIVSMVIFIIPELLLQT